VGAIAAELAAAAEGEDGPLLDALRSFAATLRAADPGARPSAASAAAQVQEVWSSVDPAIGRTSATRQS
jgi:hypothetical protein